MATGHHKINITNANKEAGPREREWIEQPSQSRTSQPRAVHEERTGRGEYTSTGNLVDINTHTHSGHTREVKGLINTGELLSWDTGHRTFSGAPSKVVARYKGQTEQDKE